jgi:hypothetical protein
VEYASRLLTPAEKNYTTTEREALAIVFGVQKFRGYLEGARVIVASDHQPLKWLMSLRSPSGRLARWALLLQSFDLRVDYIPGRRNVVADMLSRPPIADLDASSKLEACFASINIPTVSATELRNEQLRDETLKKIVRCFEDGADEGPERWTDRGYVMSGGILYRYVPDSETEEPATGGATATNSCGPEGVPRFHPGRPSRRGKDHRESQQTLLLVHTEARRSKTCPAMRGVPKVQIFQYETRWTFTDPYIGPTFRDSSDRSLRSITRCTSPKTRSPPESAAR